MLGVLMVVAVTACSTMHLVDRPGRLGHRMGHAAAVVEALGAVQPMAVLDRSRNRNIKGLA
jgi:hypothetical protein